MVLSKTVEQTISIDKEFAGLIPAISQAELAQLHANLEAEGCIDALVVWDCGVKLILLDGHNRYRWCKKSGSGYRVKKLEFADRNAARNWIINHQLGRRNITDEQRRYLLGKLWRETVKDSGGRPKTSETVSEVSEAPVTAETIADAHGVTPRTVQNAADFAETVDAIGEKSKELKKAILAGDVTASASDLEALAEAPKRTVESVAKKVGRGNKRAIKEAIKKPAGIDTEAAEQEDLAEANQTPAERCEAHNKAIESFCRNLTQWFKDNTPDLPWVTEGLVNSARGNLKAACDTFRGVKCAVCPACEGGGCSECKDVGYLPTGTAAQLGRIR